MLVESIKMVFHLNNNSSFYHAQTFNPPIKIDMEKDSVEFSLSIIDSFRDAPSVPFIIYLYDSDGNDLGLELIDLKTKNGMLSAKIHREKIRL